MTRFTESPRINQITRKDICAEVEKFQLSKDQLQEMYETMQQIRAFEWMADKLYALGKVHGTMHLSIGQEAVAIGTARALRSDDYLINHHRGHGHFISKHPDLNKMMAEFLGKEAGYCRGRGGSMHIADIESNNLGANGIVGGGIPLAVGVGLAIQMRKLDQICICIFGDGASNEGVFHESLNMAALWKLPILFLCENNHYGMSNAVSKSTAKLPISQRGDAYGIPNNYVDGNDVMTVYAAVKEAEAHIRGGNGPYLLETETYRWKGHSKSDRNLYRKQDEIEEWMELDPIVRFGEQLISCGYMTRAEADELKKRAETAIEDAVSFAENSPEPEISTLMDWIYA